MDFFTWQITWRPFRIYCGKIQANAIGTEFETAFEMSASNIRYGPGVTREVGMDFKNLKAKRVLLMTDKNLSELPPVQQARLTVCYKTSDRILIKLLD